jgi:hypothetical protein
MAFLQYRHRVVFLLQIYQWICLYCLIVSGFLKYLWNYKCIFSKRNLWLPRVVFQWVHNARHCGRRTRRSKVWVNHFCQNSFRGSNESNHIYHSCLVLFNRSIKRSDTPLFHNQWNFFRVAKQNHFYNKVTAAQQIARA